VILNVSNANLLLERVTQSQQRIDWQNHKKQAVLDMLTEVPKWVKMTKIASKAPLVSAPQPQAEVSPSEVAGGISATLATGKNVDPSLLAPESPTPELPQEDESEASLWNMSLFLKTLQETSDAKERAPVTKSPAKEHARGIFDLLPRLHFRYTET
jgi:hypothetical protein